MIKQLIWVLISAAAASKLAIVEPIHGTVWKADKEVVVRWEIGPNPLVPINLPSHPKRHLSQIDIDLISSDQESGGIPIPGKGLFLVENISIGVPLSIGQAEWIVKKELKPGAYFVRITSPEDKQWSVDGERFQVDTPGLKANSNESAKIMEQGWIPRVFGALLAFIVFC